MSQGDIGRHVKALEGNAGEAAAAAKALGTLACAHSNRACAHANRDAIAKAGAIPPLVTLVTNGSAGGQVQAAWALANLADGNFFPNEHAIAEAGAIPPLVALVRSGTARDQAQAARALRNLARWNDANGVAIIAAGGFEPLVAHATNGAAGDREWVVNLLMDIAKDNAANQAAIVAAGGIAALVTRLVALVRHGWEDGRLECYMTKRALDSLARDNTTSAAIVNAAAVDPLVALLTNGSNGDREQAARELANFALCDTIREAIVDAGAIPPLVELVRNGAAGGQEEAARALQSLACDDALLNRDDANLVARGNANVAAIVAAGAVEPLIALARDAESSESLKHEAELALDYLNLLPDTSEVLWQLQTLRDENASLKRRLDRVIAAAQASDSEEQPPQKRARG